mmetsp:Transcript_10204/g.28828  ORF Transcript_10204/g.28828 Transcript_10204/m.28828 type:complete len:200 (+) Transcript_10204:367-966(+)
MDLVRLEKVVAGVEILQLVLGARQSEARALLHDIAELACGVDREGVPATARGPARSRVLILGLALGSSVHWPAHLGGLDVEGRATDSGPREAHHHARRRDRVEQLVALEARLADILFQLVLGDLPVLFVEVSRLAGQELERDLAVDALDVLLELAHAGFAAVPAGKGGDRRLVEPERRRDVVQGGSAAGGRELDGVAGL